MRRKGLKFVPVAGEPLEIPVGGVSPTRAAQLLAEKFVDDQDTGYYVLNGVASRIPKRMEANANIIREFVSGFKDYGIIFDGDSPLMANVDMIITGIGNALSSRDDPWFNETKNLEGIDDLEAFAVGNIGGVLLPKDRYNPEHCNRVDEINGRWLGIQKDHFQKAAERAAPGVVLVAVEPEKAPIVAQAIGMVNHLIIDQQLANALIDLELESH